MSNNNNPEVIDPDDQRYKDKDYFNKKIKTSLQTINITL